MPTLRWGWALLLACVVAGACAPLDNLASPDAGTTDTGASTDAGSDVAVDSTVAPPCSTDLTSDAKHCGRCGHDCLGGICEKGVCQPVRLAIDRQNLFGIVVDDTHVYYFENVPQLVGRVSKTGGGTPETVCPSTPGFPQPFAIDATSIYCATTTGLTRAAKSSPNARTTLLPPQRVDVLLVDDTHVYGVISKSEGTSFKVLKTGGVSTPLPINDLRQGPVTAAQDATTLYANHDFDGLYRSAKTNTSDAGVVRVLDAPEPSGVAVDAQYVFVSVRISGSIKRVPVGGGAPTTVAAGVNAPGAIALDATDIYFTTGDGSIVSCPRDGCPGSPRVLAEKQAEATGIAVDATAVYWTTRAGGTVMRVAK